MKIDWPSYNRSLVIRGEILFSYDFLDNYASELERINKKKLGNRWSPSALWWYHDDTLREGKAANFFNCGNRFDVDIDLIAERRYSNKGL